MSLINIRSSFSGYRASINQLNFKQYNSVIQQYLKWMADILLDTGEVILCGLGKVSIIGRERNFKKLAVDFVQTKKMGKTIYHLNEHTDGVHYSFRWYRGKVRVRYKFCYKLKITKPNRRRLYNLITKYGKEYRIL